MKGNKTADPLENFKAPEGVMYHPGRIQEWTVWKGGQVIKFCSDRVQAETVYRTTNARRCI